MPNPPVATTAPVIRWKAYADRVAHAYHRAGARGSRSLCTDVAELPERFEVPVTEAASRCGTCSAVAEQLEVDAIPEGESRAMWGNR